MWISRKEWERVQDRLEKLEFDTKVLIPIEDSTSLECLPVKTVVQVMAKSRGLKVKRTTESSIGGAK